MIIPSDRPCFPLVYSSSLRLLTDYSPCGNDEMMEHKFPVKIFINQTMSSKWRRMYQNTLSIQPFAYRTFDPNKNWLINLSVVTIIIMNVFFGMSDLYINPCRIPYNIQEYAYSSFRIYCNRGINITVSPTDSSRSFVVRYLSTKSNRHRGGV